MGAAPKSASLWRTFLLSARRDAVDLGADDDVGQGGDAALADCLTVRHGPYAQAIIEGAKKGSSEFRKYSAGGDPKLMAGCTPKAIAPANREVAEMHEVEETL